MLPFSSRTPLRRLPLPAALWFAPVAALLTGCGGSDFGQFNRSLNGDISNGYGSSLASRASRDGSGNGALAGRGTYPKIETSFQLPEAKGDPFDYENTNVQVTLRKPDNGTVDVPAFYDGDNTWRMRYTPTLPGTYAVTTVKLNKETAHEEKLDKKEWNVTGDPEPGFVRVDRGDHSRFQFDNGDRYYPLGHNQAWRSDKLPDTPALLDKMHDAGENWTRVWTTYWDGKNLDWPQKGKPDKLGDLDMGAARKWDAIFEAAAKDHIYLQMVLQHHGQYSSKGGYKFSSNVNSNWDENPYNVKNGGFLQSPEDFFTDPKARALTKRKLYYTIARWGYSPNLLAYELFNEVQFTDAAKGKLWDNIALWHREMALFIRQYDPNRHLVTTSSAPDVALDGPIWETVDYVQTHTYPQDVVTALSGDNSSKGDKKLDKPSFVGEFGPSELKDDRGDALHNGLWASLLSNNSGAAQYWDWDNVEQHNLYSHFKAASAFITASGLATQGGLTRASLPVTSAERGALSFAPGGGFEAAKENEFVIGESGPPPGMSKFPAFLQGQSHRDMMPKPLTLQVNYQTAGAFRVTVGQISKQGGTLRLTLDGKATEQAWPASDANHAPETDKTTLTLNVPAGAHTITLENPGADWVTVRRITLDNYGSALGSLARMSNNFLAAWVFNREGINNPDAAKSVGGKIALSGLKAGHYHATWWDTRTGQSLSTSEVTVENSKAAATTLDTPPVTRDVALYVTTSARKPEKTAARKSTANAASHRGAETQSGIQGRN